MTLRQDSAFFILADGLRVGPGDTFFEDTDKGVVVRKFVRIYEHRYYIHRWIECEPDRRLALCASPARSFATERGALAARIERLVGRISAGEARIRKHREEMASIQIRIAELDATSKVVDDEWADAPALSRASTPTPPSNSSPLPPSASSASPPSSPPPASHGKGGVPC